jgi:hypothetical protein
VVALLRLFGAVILVGALNATRLGTPGRFGNAVRDIIDGIEPGHVLFLQEINSMAFPLGEHGDQHVRAGHLFSARRLDVNRGALQHALETRSRLGVIAMGRDKVGEFVIDVVQHLAAQTVEVDAARAQNGNRVLILGERQQEMFERGILVPALIGMGESPMQRLFKIA